MAGDSNRLHHTDWDTKVKCIFKHVSSKADAERIFNNIEAFRRKKDIDKKALAACGENDDGEYPFMLTRREANDLRDNLSKVLTIAYSSVWFTIVLNPLHSLVSFRALSVDDDDETICQRSKYTAFCQFGSLRSYDTFYSHYSFDNGVLNLSFHNVNKKPDTLNTEFGENRRLVISLNSIQKKNILVNIGKPDTGVLILLPLKYAPHITELKMSNSQNPKTIRICNDEQNPSYIKTIAHCSDIVLHFSPSDAAWPFLAHLTAEQRDKYEINFASFKVAEWSSQKKQTNTPDPFTHHNASFQDRYALKMLTSLGFVFRDKWAQLTDKELGWNNWNPIDRYLLCCYAKERLCKDHGYDLTRTARDHYAKKQTKNEGDDDEQTMSIDKRQQLKVAVCTLTPLRIIFQPLELTTGSRALRDERFGGSERFLLVHFRDEDNRGQRGFPDSVKQRLRKIMIDGITSLGYTFKFMGTSTGQMKELAFWFVDLPWEGATIKQAHEMLGNFNSIKNVATYIARVGQYFSTTWPIGIVLNKVKSKEDIPAKSDIPYALEIDDVKRYDYCFTDGIGKISWGLAGRVAQRMKIPLYSKEDIPSAFQIRIAGCKGMVAIDPVSTLNDYYIHVRPSMIKFPSDNWDLEICEFSRPMTLSFNNQVIRLLRDLDNPDSVFLSFQAWGLQNTWQIPEDEQPSVIDIALHKNISYAKAKENLLKNRIPVPPTDGRNMFGVADETCQLKYGQCFIQYSSLDYGQRKYHIVEGDVLVTKNPCMYPGDFRKLKAVRNDALEACMRDVIVFPINGNRPHSNEISGSDLDGDQYWVYWGRDLVIKKEVEPLSYEGVQKLEVPIINQEIIVDHIVETFGAGGILGMIANTHTVAADKDPQHTFSPDCKRLAELFAIAVDAPKTGKGIDRRDIQPYQAKYCKGWPHFMRKFSETPYTSTSILEKLFFQAKEAYFELKEAPLPIVFAQLQKAGKHAAAITIKDKSFARWLDGQVYKRTTNANKDISNVVPKSQGKKSTESEDDDSENHKRVDSQLSMNLAITTDDKPLKSKKLPPTPKKTVRRPPNTNQESSSAAASSILTTENSPSLLNSAFEPTTSLSTDSPPSLSILTENESCRLTFLIATGNKTTARTVLKFSQFDGLLWTVDQEKAATENPDKKQTIDIVTSFFMKENVLNKSPVHKQLSLYGQLCLIVAYGHIYFLEQNSFPHNIGELQNRIQENDLIRFTTANINELNTSSMTHLQSSEENIVYEFDCRLSTSPSQYITLLYDSSKKLRKVNTYRIWSKCFLREPNAETDSLYELRSTITYELGTTEYDKLISSVFRSSQSTNLICGRKPNVKCNFDLLHSFVESLGLRMVEECKQIDNIDSNIQAFYRTIKNIPINQQEENQKLFQTIEFVVLPISKNQELLNRICSSASDLTNTKQAN